MINENNLFKIEKNSTFWEFIKYCIVGGTGTIIDVGIYTVLTRIFNVYYILAAGISVFIAIINNFLLNKHWTFRKGKSGKTRTEYFKFFIVSVINYLLHLGIMYSIVEFTKLDYIFGKYEDFIAKFMAIAIITISNYVGNKYWTFKDETKT